MMQQNNTKIPHDSHVSGVQVNRLQAVMIGLVIVIIIIIDIVIILIMVIIIVLILSFNLNHAKHTMRYFDKLQCNNERKLYRLYIKIYMCNYA